MRLAIAMAAWLALTGCGPSQAGSQPVAPDPVSSDPTHTVSMSVTSDDFNEGRTLAMGQVYAGFGCVGSNRSPSLSWTPVAGARSYAVTLFDPDAPGGGWWHWTVANLSADTTRLEAGAGSRRGILPTGAVQGRTDFGTSGYGGPCPPVGDAAHRYILTVYALNVATVALDDQTEPAAFVAAIRHAAIAQGTLTGRYGR